MDEIIEVILILLVVVLNATASQAYSRIGTSRTIDDSESNNKSACNSILFNIEELPGIKKGTFKCCGNDTYQPAKQTCCLKSSSQYQVHNNKRERNHICCGIRVYRRRSKDAPCEHVASNDAFLSSSKLPKLESTYLDNSETKRLICNNTYAFFVRVMREKGVKDNRFLVARISQYRRQMDGSVTFYTFMRRVRKKVPLDEYSRKRLKRKGFVIFSNYDYSSDRDFVRRRGDTVFKAPKRKFVFLRRLRKVLASC